MVLRNNFWNWKIKYLVVQYLFSLGNCYVSQIYLLFSASFSCKAIEGNAFIAMDTYSQRSWFNRDI